MLRNADADGDGRISRAEWRGPPQRFDHFDANRDGYITLDEARAGLRAPGEAPQAPSPTPSGAVATACAYQPVDSADSAWKIEDFAPDCVYAGTTLFADNTGVTPRLVEVDMRGRTVWQYRLSGEFGTGRKQTQIMDVERLGNGNTLFVLRGWGLVEIDRDGKTVWKHADEEASHDVERLPNGNSLYARGWVAKGQDHVREVTGDGKLVRAWNGLEYDRPPFAGIALDGWIHVNAIQAMSNGDVWLSLRNFSLLARWAPDNRVVEEIALPLARRNVEEYDFADQDQQVSPHGAEYREDGTVSVCLTTRNTCIDFNAKTRQRTWAHTYSGGPQLPRDVNRLPNGNHLIVTHRSIEEITPQGQAVWRLVVPAIKPMTPGRALPEHLFKAQRIGPDGSVHGH